MKKRIVFTGGGTLGHIMPNISLMNELKNEYDISYIGGAGIEKEKMNSLGVDYHQITTVKFDRSKILGNLKIPFLLIRGIRESMRVLKELKPDVVFSKGGYVSLPVCLAARKLRIPIVAHESDYSFGLANKIILRLCDKMCVNFASLAKGKNKKIIFTGPIISKEFNKKDKATGFNLDPNKTTLLIIGGSLGSKKINEVVTASLRDILRDFNVIHITGKGNMTTKAFENYNPLETTKEMNRIYNTADFVLGRSGAGVTAECAYKHLPMLLVPLQNKASRGDQVLNANYYKKCGVAEIIMENDLTPSNLLKALNEFKNNLKNIQINYTNFKFSNGKDKILKIIKEY